MKTKEEIIYSGPYKELFEGYILYKQSLGFQLEYREKRQLFNLNKFLTQTSHIKMCLCTLKIQ